MTQLSNLSMHRSAGRENARFQVGRGLETAAAEAGNRRRIG